ncbi:MAG: serine/threonine-protein kinase [Myxococcota bacterium]
MTTESDEDVRRRLAETAVSLLGGAASDAQAGQRLGQQTLLAEHVRERLRKGLRPLPVGTESGDGSDLAIIGRLGQGGMAFVELAKQHSLDREVALKRPKQRGDETLEPALVDEARITGGLEHPNIVPIHAVGQDEVFGPVVVLKRVQGAVWADVLREDRAQLPADPAVLDKHLRILMQVCNALHYAHSRGVIHRDVKPSNVMLGDYGEVYLMDWGVALKREDAASESARIAGTAAYMAPEMVRAEAEAQDARTDVYLVGATLHEVLTGKRRHAGDSLMATLMQALVSLPFAYAPPVPAGLGAIANRACHADASLRFPSAAALREALSDFMEHREARLLVSLAETLLDELEAYEGDGGFQAEVERRFHEAHFAIEQANLIRADHPAIGRLRRRLRLAMIRDALAREDISKALALTEELAAPPPPELRAELDATRRRVDSRTRHIEALEQDADLLRGSRLRIWGTSAVALLLTVRHAVSLAEDPGPGHDLDPARLLVGMSAISAVMLTALATSRRRLSQTRPDRSFFRLLSSFCLTTPIVIYAGMRFGMTVPSILTVITLASSGLLLAVQVPFPSIPFGVAGLVAGLLASLFPDAARYLFMAWTLVTVLGMVVDLRSERARELERLPEGRPPPASSRNGAPAHEPPAP